MTASFMMQLGMAAIMVRLSVIVHFAGLGLIERRLL